MKKVIIERSGRNPRRIKRLINSFVLEYHLNRSWDEVGTENLIKVIMLQHFYPDFYQILTNPRHEDSIIEFLKYNEFRSAVKQGANLNPDDWSALFQGKGLKPPSGRNDSEEFLAALEGELPADFPILAADRDFTTLIESFGDSGIDATRLHELLRRPLTTAYRPTRDRAGFGEQVDTKIAESAAQVLQSLISTENAVIQIGSLLIVKSHGRAVVRQLTMDEMESLRSKPDLLQSPHDVLDALGVHLDDEGPRTVN